MIDLSWAIALCKKFEGFRAKPYRCPAGVWTVGYGSTFYADGTRVTKGDKPITEAEALDLLTGELERRYLPGALMCCPNLAKHPGKCNAIVDFCYNLGVGRLQSSTLARKIRAEQWDDACLELAKWCRGGGRVLPGLVARCAARIELFQVVHDGR